MASHLYQVSRRPELEAAWLKVTYKVTADRARDTLFLPSNTLGSATYWIPQVFLSGFNFSCLLPPDTWEYRKQVGCGWGSLLCSISCSGAQVQKSGWISFSRADESAELFPSARDCQCLAP